jgi:catechol 2,3-dioxygenase-like lactoylglutathione lyase family enzyme
MALEVRMQEVRLEGLTLRVESVRRSIEFYGRKLGFSVEIDKAPHFAMIRVGGPQGGTIGLLAFEGPSSTCRSERAGIHIELTTDRLDTLYEELTARGVEFFEPPHEEPWERSMRAYDPDGYTVEFAEGRRGHRGATW